MTATSRAPIHLWIVGVLSLLWNAMGAFDYTATKLELDFYLSSFPQEMLDWVAGFPAWATAAWAFGVWGALAGSIGLLARRRWAVWAFGISLLGLAASTLYQFGLSNGLEIMGTPGAIFTGAIWAVAIFLLLYRRSQARSGVLA